MHLMNTKSENMARSLKDLPLIVSSWKCRIGWHTWERWSDPYIGKDKWDVAYNLQKKSCIHCNRVEVRKLEGFIP